ncbi:MAG: peptide-methionine (R)-S-oxide reductase [Mangrovicoccus sp.]
MTQMLFENFAPQSVTEALGETLFRGPWLPHPKMPAMYHCAQCDAPLYSSDALKALQGDWILFSACDTEKAVRTRIDAGFRTRRRLCCGNCKCNLGFLYRYQNESQGMRHRIRAVQLEMRPLCVT